MVISYITIIGCMVLMPVIYWLVMWWYRPFFQEEENRKRLPFTSVEEVLSILIGEIALYRIWNSLERPEFSDMIFSLLYIILVGMTIICFTDYWEKIVPNRILLGLVLIYILIVGFQGVHNLETIRMQFVPIALGFLFSLISFGLVYLLGKGSMGAGDVKLALIMGIYMTSNYVVGAILYGCIISAVYSVIQLIRKRVSRKDHLPFVPFLYIGVVIQYMIG